MTTSILNKMRVVGKLILNTFKKTYSDAQEQIDSWVAEVEAAIWNKPMDIKLRFPSASILAENHIVFNIKGNKYRLLTKVEYQNGVVLIKNAGTHREYSRWKLT